MKKILFMAAAVLLCASCLRVNTKWNGSRNAVRGEGRVISKSFEFKDFDAIVINGHADVDFYQSDTYEVTLTTQENIFDYVDYRVDGTTLILQNKDKKDVRAEEYDLVIRAPQLKSIVVNGATDFNVKGLRTDGDFTVQVNGAGDLEFERIACNDLSIEVNGAADAELTSIEVLRNLKVVVNGAGDVDVTGSVQNAFFEVNGAGDIDATGLKVAGEVSKRRSGLASIKLP